MSPLERLSWLRQVRDAGAIPSALAVAIEVAFRDGGDGAWGSLGGAAINDRSTRFGRAWLEAAGFVARRGRAWFCTLPTGNPLPESGSPLPESGSPLPEWQPTAETAAHCRESDTQGGKAATHCRETGNPLPESGSPLPQNNIREQRSSSSSSLVNPAIAQEPPRPPAGQVDDQLASMPTCPPAREVRQHTVGDLVACHPSLLCHRPDDRDRARTMLALYGWVPMTGAIRELEPIAKARPEGKRRVLLSELGDHLAKVYELEPEDYRRAGLPVPEEATCP